MTFDSDSILTVLIVQSSRAAVLILAILFLRLLLGKRIPPAWRHAIWGLVPLQLLLVVSIPSSISLFNLFPAQAETQDVAQDVVQNAVQNTAPPVRNPDIQPDVTPDMTFDAAPVDDIPVLSEAELAQIAAIAEAFAKPDPVETDTFTFNEIPTATDETAVATVATVEGDAHRPEVALRSTPGSLRSGSLSFTLVILVVWGLGCCVMIVVFVRQILRCRRWVARGKPVTSEPVLQLFEESCRRMKIKTWLVVAESSAVRSPFLIGAIRPKLLLPQRMVESASAEQLHAVFLHELAHLKRWDIWTGWLMTLLLIVHWFNPLLWLAIRRMNADREEACDVMAMNTLDRMQQGRYAHSLLDIAQQFVGPTHAPGLVGISETGKFLSRRIDMLKQIGTWKLRWKVLALGLALLIAAVTLTDAQEKKTADQPAKTAEQLQAEVERLQTEIERLKATDNPVALNNDRKLFSELLGFYEGESENQIIKITLLDKDNANISTMGAGGMVQEKYQPKNPDAAFLMTFDVLVTNQHEHPRTTASYFGEASFVNKNELAVHSPQKLYGLDLPESLENLAVQIIRDGDDVTLLLPETQLWDELRVTKPKPSTAFTDSRTEEERALGLGPRVPTPQPVRPNRLDPNLSKASMIQKDMANMKQLVLACHNYHDMNKTLPSASTADKDGKPLHSWRVALLPMLGQEELYGKIRHDEPWDSEYNRQFHRQMPDAFRSPFLSDEDAKIGRTLYAVVVGDRRLTNHMGTGGGMGSMSMGGMAGSGVMGGMSRDNSMEPIFGGVNHWRGFGGITDGTSNTVAIVMRAMPGCWMDPDSDVPFDIAIRGIISKEGPVSGIGSQNVPELSDKAVTPLAFMDGRVELVSADLPKDILRTMIACNSGKNVSMHDWLVDPEPKIAVAYEVPPSVEAERVVAMVKALLGGERDFDVMLSADRKRLRFVGRKSDHEKVEVFFDVFKLREQEGPQRRIMIYRLINLEAEKAVQLLRPLFPNAVIVAEPETNSLIISAMSEEFELIRKTIAPLDQAADHGRVVLGQIEQSPPAVNPGVIAPQPVLTRPDPIIGKYLAEDDHGTPIGIVLTRKDGTSTQIDWPIPHTVPGVTQYQIVVYGGGLPGEGFSAEKGRMIGSATYKDNKQLAIEWELSHDGTRYRVVNDEERQSSARFLRDGETTLLLISIPESNAEDVIATKVGEDNPAEQPPR